MAFNLSKLVAVLPDDLVQAVGSAAPLTVNRLSWRCFRAYLSLVNLDEERLTGLKELSDKPDRAFEVVAEVRARFANEIAADLNEELDQGRLGYERYLTLYSTDLAADVAEACLRVRDLATLAPALTLIGQRQFC